MFQGFQNMLQKEKSKQKRQKANKIKNSKQANQQTTTNNNNNNAPTPPKKKLNKRNTINEITRFGRKFQLPHTLCCTSFHIPYSPL